MGKMVRARIAMNKARLSNRYLAYLFDVLILLFITVLICNIVGVESSILSLSSALIHKSKPYLRLVFSQSNNTVTILIFTILSFFYWFMEDIFGYTLGGIIFGLKMDG